MESCGDGFALRDEALKFYIQCISSKISNDISISKDIQALLYIWAIVHCFTKHASEFKANGLVGDIQTLNCTDLDSWGFPTELQTDLILKNKKLKERLENARIGFIGRPSLRKLNVPLNPSIPEDLIPAIVDLPLWTSRGCSSVSINVLSGAETTGVLHSEVSQPQGKSLYKSDELYNTEGGQFKAKKKELREIVLESINKTLGADGFDTPKGRQLALSVAQDLSKLCGEEVSKASSINILLIETVQQYLSHLKQFGRDDKEQRNQFVTILAPLYPISGMTATCFMDTFGISRRMFDRVKEKKLEFYNICELEHAKHIESEESKYASDDDDKSTDSSSEFSNDSDSEETSEDEDEGEASDMDDEDEGQSPDQLGFGEMSTELSPLPTSSSSSSTTSKTSSSSSVSVGRMTTVQIAAIKLRNVFRKYFKGKDRKCRVDHRDLEFVRHWIKDGNNEVTRMDNDSVSILVPNTTGTMATYHKRHTQLMSIPDAHAKFKKSTEYLQWSQRNAREVIDKNGVVKRVLGSIGLELFRLSWCPCITKAKQRDCANVVIVEFSEALKAWAYLRKFDSVKKAINNCRANHCTTHCNELYLKAPNSLKSALRYFLCPEKVREDLGYTGRGSDVSLEQLQEANMVNSQMKLDDHLENQLGLSKTTRKRSSGGGMKVLNGTAPEKLIDGSFTIQDRNCFCQECDKCGVQRNLSDACKSEFEADSNLSIPVYVYVNGTTTRKQLEKVKTMMSPSKLFDHLQKCMHVAFPRLWEMYWGSAMRRFNRATFTDNTTILAWDYSAVFEINPQDRVNNYIPIRGDQLVIIASHSPVEVDVPGDVDVKMRVYTNDVHHVISKNGAIVQPNYFACDMVRYMLTHFYKSEHFIYENDGCKDQFKSRLAVYIHQVLLSESDQVSSIIVNFAATGDFKGTHDGEGFNFKNALKTVEKNDTQRLPTVWDVHKAIPEIMGQPPDVPANMRSNPNHISNRFFWYIVDRHEATEEQIQRRWSPDTSTGDVLIVDVDRDNWDCTPVKDISKLRQWIFYKNEHSGDSTSNSNTMEDQTLPTNNSILGNSATSVASGGVLSDSTVSNFQSGGTQTVIDNTVMVTAPALCETSLPPKIFLTEYHNVSSNIRRDPCYCLNCRNFDFNNCLYSVHVGPLSSMNTKYKTPTRELRISVDQNDRNPFEGDIQGESKILVAYRDADEANKIQLALMTSKISKLTSNKTLDQNDAKVTFLKSTNICSVKVMSVLPQTKLGDINYDTYYIPTNTKPIVIAASSIIQPGCLFAEDQAFTRFNYLRYQESTTTVERNQKNEKKTTFLVPPTSMTMLFQAINGNI